MYLVCDEEAEASYVAGFPVPLPHPDCTQHPVVVTVLGLVGGAPGGETPRVADSSAAGAAASFITGFPYLLLVSL